LKKVSNTGIVTLLILRMPISSGQPECSWGKSSLLANVKKLGNYGWDVQVSQKNLSIINGKQYKATFWAKTDGANSQLSAAIINSTDNTLYANKTFSVTPLWTQIELSFTANTSATVAFNIDFGSNVGTFFLDDFVSLPPNCTITIN